MTICHSLNGNTFQLIYGGSEVPLTTPTYKYARTTLSGENLRAFETSKIAIGGIVLGTQKNNQMGMTIENVVPGLVYKTNDIGKAEQIRTAIGLAVNSDNIQFDMSGPMVNAINIEGLSCSTVASNLGNLMMTANSGGAVMQLDINTFLRSTGSGCKIYLSILVFSGQDDQLVIGQMLFNGYNVTFDYETNVISFQQQVIVVDPIPEYPGYVTAFVSLMVFFVLLSVLFLYLVLCRKGAKTVKEL